MGVDYYAAITIIIIILSMCNKSSSLKPMGVCPLMFW